MTQTIQATTPRVSAAAATAQQQHELAVNINTFAIDLYRRWTPEHDTDNLCFSPYSIVLAFSMLYAGARGTTEQELAQIFHYLPQAAQHQTLNALDQQIMRSAQDTSQPDTASSPFELASANAIWGQAHIRYSDQYLDLLARYYGAGLRIADFTRSQETAASINAWIAEQTRDRIKDMVTPQMVTPSTRLLLANAVYFKASWRVPFNATLTRPGPFTLRNGSTVDVPLMYQPLLHAPYYQHADYQAVQLPYVGDSVDMLVILPGSGRFAAVEHQLSDEMIAAIRTQSQFRALALTMPRFDFKTELDLGKQLTKLGLIVSFGSSADFSGIVPDNDLFVSEALHQSTITVDESGTEAAAATVIGVRAGMSQQTELKLDRPFLFAVIERASGTMLFLGRVMHPAQ